MFEQLKKAFSSATRSISQKEITSKDLEKTLFEIELDLLECDVAQEAIDDIFAKLKDELVGLKLEKDQSSEELISSRLEYSLAQMFVNSGSIDLLQKIRLKSESKSGPFVIVFVGINGTGKTTTVAKVGNLLQINGLSAVMAAADTHRSGAIEQLCAHGEKLSLRVIAQRYGADPSAVARDAVEYAKKHHIDAVLIDTAGRMQTSKNLMDEISKVVRVVKPDVKVFVGDSLAGNDTINQAREFFQYTNFDAAILTKADADSKGGAAISIVHITSKPILYFGIGQGYGDILPFHYDKFLGSIFSNYQLIDGQDRSTQGFKNQNQEKSTNEQDYHKQEIRPETCLAVEDSFSSRKVNIQDMEQKSFSSPPAEINTSSEMSKVDPGSVPSLTGSQVSKEDDKSTSGDLDSHGLARSNSEDPFPMKNDDTISITGKKRGLFGNLFTRKKKVKKENDDVKNKDSESERRSTDASSANDLNDNKGNRRDTGETKDHEPIYLSDEDIEDLIK